MIAFQEIDGVPLIKGDQLFHTGKDRHCDQGWVEYIHAEGCGEVRVRHRNGAVPVVKLSELQWHAMTVEQQFAEFYSELSSGGELAKRSLCHIRLQQTTIGLLQAKIAELESGRGHAIHQVRTHGSDCWEDISGESLEMCRSQPEEYEIRTLYPAAPVALLPEGYCIMPKMLTAENGAKALLLGEFKVQVTQECPECAELEEPNEYCKICDGEGEHAIHHTISWDQIKFIYSKAVAGLCVNPIRRDRLTFQFRHPSSSELRSVSLTRAEVAQEMEGTLFEKLVGQLCQCESVGETNVIDCNCNEYGHDFEQIAEDDSGATQALPFAFVLPERKGPHQYRDANYTQSCMANEWNTCLETVAISLGLKS
ncbi:hypothetical protein K5D56_21560 [Pseudomonas cichorii]|nr:hypothetical protein [Pseudomonas cichorii]MBX8557055.1 hypothetical protein [Pseudomonas cichorii]MBX8591956.1 hypothetical protein [Pseudomonas cichorii]